MSAKLARPKKLPHVRSLLYSQPWAIMDKWLDSICELYELHATADIAEIEARITKLNLGSGQEEQVAGHEMIDGVAVVAVAGPIFPRANLMTKLSDATALDDLSESLDEALAEEPSAVILDFNSPGGSVIGLAEFASRIHMLTGSTQTPILALCNGLCCSAAYMLASQCDLVYATEGSVVGSIGVIAKIDSYDRMEKNAGVDSKVFRSSELKAPGVGPLTPNQEDEVRSMVRSYTGMFVDAVKRGRPQLDVDSLATGQTWVGKDKTRPSAVDVGLADGLSTLPDLIAKYKKTTGEKP